MAARGILLLLAVTIPRAYTFSTNITDDAALQLPPPILCRGNEYRLSNRCCQKCPAGTHVIIPCSVHGARGYCGNCNAGKDFTAFPNGLDDCLPCRTCRQEEVLVEECTVMRDTRCECKPGTYMCAANMNCSGIGTCSNCSSCPAGQSIKHRCNATANTVCEYAVNLNSEETARNITICVVTCIGLPLIALCLWCIVRKTCQDPPKDHPEEIDKKTAPVVDGSDDVFIEEAPDYQDSTGSNTPLMTDKEHSKNGSISYTIEDLEISRINISTSIRSLEWLSRFIPIEGTPAASLPDERFLPSRNESRSMTPSTPRSPQ